MLWKNNVCSYNSQSTISYSKIKNGNYIELWLFLIYYQFECIHIALIKMINSEFEKCHIVENIKYLGLIMCVVLQDLIFYDLWVTKNDSENDYKYHAYY